MSIINRLLGRHQRRKDDEENELVIGYDRDQNPVVWDYEREHHCFFVGSTADCYKAIMHMKKFVRAEGQEWDYIEIYTPSHDELRKNAKGTPEKVRFLVEDINSMFAEIHRRYETDDPEAPPKQVLMVINQASLFGMNEQDWQEEYPLIPYKAAVVLHKRLEMLMKKSLSYNLHIMLLDDYFHEYEYIIERYSLAFGIEADEDGNFHKVTVA